MSIKALNPYLNFNGNGAEAIKLYETALGAKSNVQRMGDVPGMQVPAEQKDLVMHARLEIGAGVLMISDGRPGDKVTAGDNVHVTLDFDDLDDMKRRFEALSAGGKVTMPMQDTFWGATFGMLTDRFGI